MSIWGNLYSNTIFYDLLKWTFYAQNIFIIRTPPVYGKPADWGKVTKRDAARFNDGGRWGFVKM